MARSIHETIQILRDKLSFSLHETQSNPELGNVSDSILDALAHIQDVERKHPMRVLEFKLIIRVEESFEQFNKLNEDITTALSDVCQADFKGAKFLESCKLVKVDGDTRF